MKAIIKIVIAIAVLAACFNGGRAAFTNYQFEDAVHQALLFDPRASDDEMTEMVMKTAADYNVPIEKENISIRRVGPEIRIDMQYTTNVVLVPAILARDWTFSSSASTRLLPGASR